MSEGTDRTATGASSNTGTEWISWNPQRQKPPPKKELTPAERRARMRGIAKAFVTDKNSTSNDNGGWKKVAANPVTSESNSSSDDDEEDMPRKQPAVVEDPRQSSQQATKQTRPQSKPPPSNPQPPPSQRIQVQVQRSPRSDKSDAATKTPPNARVVKKTAPKSNTQMDNAQILQFLLQTAQEQGQDAAWKWVQEQVKSSPSPNAPQKMPSTATPTTTVKVPTPQRSTPLTVDMEQQFLQYFRQAVKCVPFEYSTTTTTTTSTKQQTIRFVVRRPYGMEDNATSARLFGSLSLQPPQHYNRKSHISAISSLEVVAVSSNGMPLLLLHGEQQVRYKRHSRGPVLDTIPLGFYKPDASPAHLNAFLPSQPKQQQGPISLDQLYQQALLVREQYCSTMISTALGLKSRPKEVVTVTKEVEKEPTTTTMTRALNATEEKSSAAPQQVVAAKEQRQEEKASLSGVVMWVMIVLFGITAFLVQQRLDNEARNVEY